MDVERCRECGRPLASTAVTMSPVPHRALLAAAQVQAVRRDRVRTCPRCLRERAEQPAPEPRRRRLRLALPLARIRARSA